MKSSKVFKKGLAMVCAATTIATLTPSVGLLTSTVSTFAATKVRYKHDHHQERDKEAVH